MLPDWFGAVVVFFVLVAAALCFLELLRRQIMNEAERDSASDPRREAYQKLFGDEADYIDVGPDPSELETVLTSYDPVTEDDVAPIEDDE